MLLQLGAKLPFIYHILNFFVHFFSKIFKFHGSLVAFALFADGNLSVFSLGLRQFFAVRAVERADDFFLTAFPVKADLNFGSLEIILHRSADGKVADVILGPGEQINVTENTAHAQLVLILQIAAVAPFHYQNGEKVFTGSHKGGDLEFACAVRYLAVADKFAVNPYIETGINTLKIQEIALFCSLS